MPPFFRLLAAGALVLAAAGCAQLPDPQRAEALAVHAAIRTAADQVKRCYRSPKVASAGKQISTRLRVRLAPDGTLAALPELVAQGGVTPLNQPYATRMAEAASMAVIRCAPLRLPPELYRAGWREMDLTFSPRALA